MLWVWVVVVSLAAGGTGAAASTELVFYSTVPRDLSEALVKGYEAKYPDVKVSLWQAGVETVLEKMELETRGTGRPKADVVWIEEPAAMDRFAKRGLLEKYPPKDSEQIPAVYRDKEGYWTGNHVGHTMIFYNNRLVPKEQAPKSWKDMADPRFKNKLGLSNPKISGTGAALASAMVQLYGWKFWEDVAKNRPLLAPGTQAMVSTVIQGERLLAATQDYTIAAAIRKGQPIGFTFPEEGVFPFGAYVGIVKGTQGLEAARNFVDFFVSKDTAAIMHRLGMYHTRIDAPAPEGWPPIGQIKLLPFNWEEHERDKPAMKKRFSGLMGG